MGVTTSTGSAYTYVPITTYPVTSNTYQVTLGSIPQTYTDLVLVSNII